MNETVTNVQFDYFKRVLKEEGFLDIKAFGGCMWPTFKDGQVVRIVPVAIHHLNIGDVVLTYVDSRFYCHRIVKKGLDYIQTKADALVGRDARAHEQNILGRVVAKKKGDDFKWIDHSIDRIYGRLIAWITVLTAPLYPSLRRIKNATFKFG